MSTMKGKNCGQCSGQILVIAILVVSLVLLSTQLYIYEVSRSLEGDKAIHVTDFVLAIRLGSNNVVTGSLVNISTGGDSSILSANLEGWASFVGGLYQFGKPVLNFMLRNAAPYINGTQISWGTNGFGVSGVYVDVNFSLADGQVNIQLPYALNVTTSLVVEGVYRTLTGFTKQINITCNLFNEENPALAQNMTIFYESSSSWLRADEQSNYSFVDYGNGTYWTSFEAEVLEESVNMSAQVYDLRGIYVQANTACTNLP